MRKQKEKTLYARITKPVQMLWVGAIVLMMILMEVFIHGAFQPTIQELSLDMLESKANSISVFLDAQMSQLIKFGEMLDTWDGREACIRELRTANQVKEEFGIIGLVARNGTCFSTGGDSFSIAGESYYQQAVRKGLTRVLSAPMQMKNTDGTYIVMLAALRNDTEDMEYILGAVSVTAVRQMMEQSNTFDFCTKIVRDEDGYAAVQVGKSVKDEEKVQEYSKPVKKWPGWSLVLEIPSSFFFREMNILTGAVVCVAVCILVVVIFLLKRITNRAVVPLKRLTEAMEDRNLRQLEQYKGSANTLEIKQLAESFNRMVANTENLMQKLEQEELKKKDAEYEALIQQIKPHFLYNTLETIQSMCLDYEDDRVENAIGLVADFFRSSLNHGRFWVPLQAELHQVEDYLKIQMLRYEEQFDYEIVNMAGDTIPFMRFTLQPIVENAIYHVVKRSSRKERIRIFCTTEGAYLKIKVENTCEAYDRKKIEWLNDLFSTDVDASKYPGYGLYNVNCRLKLHFGKTGCLRICGTENGVCVTVRHPILQEGELSCRP